MTFRGRPPRRRPAPAAAERSRLGWVKDAPTWMQAVAAIITPILALLAFFGIRGLAGAPGSTTPPTDRVDIVQARLDADSLAVDGSYADLLPDSETIVVLVRLSGDDSPWVADEADLEPAETSGDRQDGEWVADVPVVEEGAYEVSAAIIPARSGGGFDSSVLDELRDAGPDASIVLSSSDTVSVGD